MMVQPVVRGQLAVPSGLGASTAAAEGHGVIQADLAVEEVVAGLREAREGVAVFGTGSFSRSRRLPLRRRRGLPISKLLRLG